MFVEPGISYSRGQHPVTFNLPIGYSYNRRPNPYTGREGDATFRRHIFLTSYSLRLGKRIVSAPVLAPEKQDELSSEMPEGTSGHSTEIVCPPVVPATS